MPLLMRITARITYIYMNEKGLKLPASNLIWDVIFLFLTCTITWSDLLTFPPQDVYAIADPFFFKKKLLSSLSHQTNHMAPVQFTTRLVLPVHKYSTVRLSVQNMDKISRWRGCRSPSSVQRKGEERGKHYVLSY